MRGIFPSCELDVVGLCRAFSVVRFSDTSKADVASLLYTAARLSTRWHKLVRATDCVCVRVCLPACERLCVDVCVDACASVCACIRARVCVRKVCGLSVCAFQGVRVAVLLRGVLGMLSWCLRDMKGTRRVLRAREGYSEGTHASVERSSTTSSGSHKLTGCTLGYLGGTPRKVCSCV